MKIWKWEIIIRRYRVEPSIVVKGLFIPNGIEINGNVFGSGVPHPK